MMARHARPGCLDAILLRPERRAEPFVAENARLTESGLDGDHGMVGKLALTLIQAEHLPVIAALLGRADVDPILLRRNLVVSGLNLMAARKRHLKIGEVEVYLEGPCPPCSRMEEALGPGGYSAVRGHGGFYASVTKPGRISVGDAIRLAERRPQVSDLTKT